MALRVCPECTEAVSEHAASCPHCGFRTFRAAGIVDRPGALVGAGFALLLAGVAGGWAVRAHVAAPPPATSAVAAASDDCDCDGDDDSATDDHDDEAANAPAPASGPNALLIEAQDAYVHGEYATAVRLAKQALPSEPTRGWRVIGAAECFMHDRAAAREAWSKLGSQERSFLRYVCSRNGVTLP